MSYFSAYFDESTNKNSPIIAVAGYVAPEEQWREFAWQWEKVRERQAVKAFHWVDLENQVKDFRREWGWTNSRKLKVQKQLIKIIKDRVSVSIHIAVNVKDYEEITREYPSSYTESPYTYAARNAVAMAGNWARGCGLTEPLAYIIERSTKGYKKELRKGFEKVVEDEQLCRNMLIGTLTTDADKFQNLPLQAADAIAYETWKHMVNEQVNNNARSMRKSLISLSEVPQLLVYFDKKTMRSINEDAKRQGMSPD